MDLCLQGTDDVKMNGGETDDYDTDDHKTGDHETDFDRYGFSEIRFTTEWMVFRDTW